MFKVTAKYLKPNFGLKVRPKFKPAIIAQHNKLKIVQKLREISPTSTSKNWMAQLKLYINMVTLNLIYQRFLVRNFSHPILAQPINIINLKFAHHLLSKLQNIEYYNRKCYLHA